MSDSQILDIITENFKTSDKYLVIRDINGNIVFPRDLDSMKNIERLMKLKKQGREFYDEVSGNHYEIKSVIKYINNTEYICDFIENNNRLKKIEEKAKRDDTTKLLNKDAIMTVLDQFILNKNKDINSIAVIVCDIDKFKSINDTYGHLAGDKILKQVSNVFKSHISPNCSIGRFGGDEFVILIKNKNSTTTYQNIEKLRKEINNISFIYDGSKITHISMSFGIYATDEIKKLEITSLEQVITKRMDMFYKADEALYSSKENGRNMVTLYEQNENEKSYIVSEITDAKILGNETIERKLA